MFTIRATGGVALFLAGTTWLWLTPELASRSVDTTGALWAATRVLGLVTLLGFSAATWGLFARHPWWEGVTLGSALVGLLTLVPYAVAASRGGESAGAWTWNVLVHVVMVAGVLVLLLVPTLERWVSRHVTGT